LYFAFKKGRSPSNPADFWAKGEIGFFDFYIIPLAKKLKDCGVFGKSSDEYLNYAVRNRNEWEKKGSEIVAGMIEQCNKDFEMQQETIMGSPMPMELPETALPAVPRTCDC